MKQHYIDIEEIPVKENNEGFSFKNWSRRMLRNWPWFVLSLAICLSLSYLYLRYANPVYHSVASIVVKDEKKGAEIMDNSMMKEIGLGGNSKLVENEIEVLKSYDLMEAVVNRLQLFTSIKHIGRIRDVEVFGDDLPFQFEVQDRQKIKNPIQWQVNDTAGGVILTSASEKSPVYIRYGQFYTADGVGFRVIRDSSYSYPVSGNAEVKYSNYQVTLTPPSEAALQYSRNLSVEGASKVATVINLEMKDSNKKRAAAILQSLIAIYNRQGIEDKNRATDNTVNFLTARLSEVSGELQGVEGSVERFKSQNRVTNLSSDAQQYLDLAQQVDIQKAKSQTQLNIVNALERDLKQNETNPKLVPSTLGIEEPSLGLLIEKHNNLVLQKERQSQVSGPKNPLLIDLDEQIKEIRGRLITNVSNLKQAYAISLNDVAYQDAQLNSRIRSVPLMEKKLVQITRNQNVQEQLYAFLLQKREEAAISRASNIEDSRTILQARNLGTISPKPTMVWAFGGLLGLLIPITLIGVRGAMNNKIGDVTEVQTHTDLPILGTIPHIKKLKNPIVISTHSRTAAAEKIRSVRTAIGFTGKGRNVKTILITSFQPGEGKSFASLNLAVSYALLRKKTVILEFDLRKPQLTRNIGLKAKEGISNILAGKGNLDDLLVEVPDHDGNLFILPAGNLPPNPAELISGEQMEDLHKMLQERFDYIIIDSPPLGVVTDATLLQRYADITILVLRQNFTSNLVYEKLNQRAFQHSTQPVYIILNDMGKSKRYEDAYGYSGGYYHDKEYVA
jgi:tyrosine-protein kinase Etk/Wzc